MNKQQQQQHLLTIVLTSKLLTVTYGIVTLIIVLMVELAGRVLLAQLIYTVTAALAFVFFAIIYVWLIRILYDGQLINDQYLVLGVLIDFLLAYTFFWTTTFTIFWIWETPDVVFWTNFEDVTSAFSAYGRNYFTGIMLGSSVGFGQYVPVHFWVEQAVWVRVLVDFFTRILIIGVIVILIIRNTFIKVQEQVSFNIQRRLLFPFSFPLELEENLVKSRND